MVKAIGKGSIASILAVVLNIVRVALWLAMAFLLGVLALAIAGAIFDFAFDDVFGLFEFLDSHPLVALAKC